MNIAVLFHLTANLYSSTRLGLWTNIVSLLFALKLASGENFSVRSDWEKNPFAQLLQGLPEESDSLLRSVTLPPNYEESSPYQVIPGSYEIGDNTHYHGNGLYDQNANYAQYLASGSYKYHNAKCGNHYGQVPRVSQADLDNAFGYANNELITRYPEYANGSHYKSTDRKEVEGQLMELVSEYFGK